jgi:hypothetical protein
MLQYTAELIYQNTYEIIKYENGRQSEQYLVPDYGIVETQELLESKGYIRAYNPEEYRKLRDYYKEKYEEAEKDYQHALLFPIEEVIN